MATKRLKFDSLSYKTLLLFVVIPLIGIVALLRLNQKPESIAAWWDEGWSYRKAILISNSSGSDQTDFVVNINIGTSETISEGKMQPDCDDIRVTNYQGNILSHYVTQCNTASTNIYVKIPTTPSSGIDLYLYYGNSSATNTEDKTIFTYFEDFENQESSHWSTSELSVSADNTNPNKGSYSLHFIAQGADYDGIIQTFTITNNWTNHYLEYEFYSDTTGGVNWYTDPQNSASQRMNAWVSWSMTANIWYTKSNDLDTNTYANDIKSIMYFTGNDNINRNIFIDNFRIRKYDSSVSVGTPSTEEVSPAPIAYWKFDEGVGTTAHDSASGFDASINSGSTWKSQDSCISQNCVYITNNQPIIAPSNNLNLIEKLTISFWWKPTSNHSDYARHPISKHSSTANANFVMYFFGDYGGVYPDNLGMIRFYANRGGSWGNISDGYRVTNNDLNKWLHITLVYDSNLGGQLFVNNQPIGSRAGSGTLASNNEPIKMGDQNSYLDEVKIYPYARTPDQINADYNAGLSGVSSSKGSSAILGSSSNKPLSDGLVAHWKMDEASWNGTSGEVLDASGNNNHGTGVNNVTTGTGKFGNGGNFVSASNHYVNISDSLFDLPQRTVSLWMNNNAASGDRFAFSSGTGSPVRWYQGVSGGSNLYFRVGNGDLITLPFENLNRWVHYVITYDGTTAKAYANGQQLHSYDVTLSGATQVGIGAYNKGSGFFFSGSIDEVRIYNRALSSDEIEQLYGWTPGPVAHWKLDEGSGSTAQDSSGNNYNGSFVGTPQWEPGKYGSSLKFDGDNDYISFNNASVVNPYSGTIEAWVNASNWDSTRMTIFSSEVGPGWNDLRLVLFSNSNNSITFAVANGSSSTTDNVNTGTILSSNTWYHITGTYDGSTVKIFVNGTEKDSLTSTITPGTFTPTKTVSGWHYSDRHWNGKIDDLKIYNYARTPSQIIEDMNAGHPIGGSPVGSQVAYWRMDEGVGSTVNNSGNGGTVLNGSLTGSVPPSWSNNGKFGKALDFSSGYVQTDPTTISNTSTYTAWFKVDSFNNWGAVITNLYHSAPASGFNIIPYPDAIRVCYGDGVNGYAYRTFSVPNLTTGTWYHVAVSYDGSKFSLYFDGKHIDDHAATMVQINQFFRLGLWASSYTQYFFDGLIDEVKIYNTALTPDQIKIDMNQGKSMVLGSNSTNTGTTAPSTSASAEYCIPGDPSSCSPPVAEWKFDEGIGATAFDTSANNNHANFGAGGSSPIWVKGKESAGLKFDGNDEINTNSFSSLDNKSSATISFWASNNEIKDTSYVLWANNMVLIELGCSPTFCNPDDARIRWNLSGTWGNTHVATGAVTEINTWNYWSFTFNNGSTKIFKNGTEIYSGSDSSTTINSSSPSLQIGYRISTGGLNGKLDQFKIYDYARSPAQIALDYNRGAPIGHWRLDECQGTTINDSSGFGNHGTLTIGTGGTQTSPGTCQTTGTAWGNGASGKLNSSLSFDGTDDYITINSPQNSALDITGPLTLSAWVNIPNYNSQFAYIARADYSQYQLKSSNNGMVAMSLWDSTATRHDYCYTTGNTIPLNQWNHVLAVFDGSQVKTYLNGQLQCQTNTTYSTLNSTNGPINIAKASSYRVNGQIDDVRIYNYALTSEQVKTLYNNGAVSFQ